MFERFTDRARRVIVLAQEEARALQHNYIGTEHLLLGLIREGEGVAAKALASKGVELDATRKQVEEMIGKGNAAPNGHIPFTPHAKQVLEFSLREALQLGHSYIGTEHILLGLIREGEGVGTQVLIKMDVDLGELRSATIDMIRGNSGTGTGDGKGDLANAGGVTDKQNKSGSAILDQFGRNLTAEAAEGKLDPVIGRTNEIERVMVVLSRRTKNNPVLIGEAALRADLAGLEPGGAKQLSGFFHPVLLDVLDGRDAQHLPETAQTGALAEGHAARDELDCQLFCVVFLHEAEHLFHPLGGDLLLLGDFRPPAHALGAQQPQGQREVVAHPVLVVEWLIRHGFPALVQTVQHLFLPRHQRIQKEKWRGVGLGHGADELLPEDSVHAAHKARMEHARVEQGCAFRCLLHRVEDARVDEHSLPGLQGEAGLVDVHMERSLRAEHIFKLFVPVPRHRIAGQILGIAGDGKQRTAVLHKFPALFAGDDVAADI